LFYFPPSYHKTDIHQSKYAPHNKRKAASGEEGKLIYFVIYNLSLSISLSLSLSLSLSFAFHVGTKSACKLTFYLFLAVILAPVSMKEKVGKELELAKLRKQVTM